MKDIMKGNRLRASRPQRAHSTSALRRPGLAAVAALGLVATGALAQSRQVPAPPQERPVIIHSATVHTVSGAVLEEGYVIFEDGVITAVGEGTPPSRSDVERIDAEGLHVYPGLISSQTSLGLTETGSVDVTHDHTELGPFKPEVRAAVAVNPDSDLIPVTRSNGILTALTMPRGGVVSGRASIIRLDGWTWEDMAIDAEAALVLNWPRSSPFGGGRFGGRQREAPQAAPSTEAIDTFFDEAALYQKARDADPTIPVDLRYEAMQPALRGDKPILVNASAAPDIEAAVAWALRRELRIVIVGGHEADAAAPLLAAHDVPVIISGVHRLPRRRHAAYDEPFTLPSRLHEAGVRFCIASGSQPAHERTLNHNAATAAAYGLPREHALRAVTLSAAEIIGIGDTHGSIEEGKVATLIVTSGDPLEITSDVLIAFVDGRRVDLGDRQKALYEKYRQKYAQLGLIK